uniref:Putative DNA binding, helix-turn-helix domain containing protein n=1 Tax=viral metagenome TaxID=1070528 RepID=A0A6M3J4F4_9ZZZZ
MPKQKHELTQQEFAALLGIHQSRVSRYIKSGILDSAIRREGRRTFIDPEKAKDNLRANLDPAYHAKAISDAEPEQKTTGGLDVTTARALKMHYEAGLKKLEYEQKRGKLIEIEKIETAAFNAARKIRDQCLAIPDRCAALVAAESDRFECNTILKREITFILENLANELEELSR